MSNTMDLDMKMKMPDSVLKAANMPPDGISIKMVTTQVLSTKTGVQEAGGSFPYEMKLDTVIVKATVNNAEQPTPMNLKMGLLLKGKCSADGKMHIDTLSNAKADPQTQQTMKEMMNKMIDQIKFPEKPMTVGESFKQQLPFAMPVLGQNSQINMDCLYKLTAIKGNQAFFDIDIHMNMDMFTSKAGDANMSIKGTGQGSGKMIYTIDKNYPVDQTGNLDMKMDMAVKGINMQMAVKATYDEKTEISAN